MTCQFLCYDLKGIQSFIFQIPKLRRIVGGSALVDRFDRVTANSLGMKDVEYLFSGGGRGAYRCKDKNAASRAIKWLTAKAHDMGASIAFGRADTFSDAAHEAQELHSFLPENLKGHPCAESGLYPVTKEGDVHSTVAARWWSRGDEMTRWFELRLSASPMLQPQAGPSAFFFRNLEVSNTDDRDDQAEAQAASAALGNRNRWAIIAMDGNDMGRQFEAATRTHQGDALVRWIRSASAAIDGASLDACIHGLNAVVTRWREDAPKEVKAATFTASHDGEPSLCLPFRPLVIGGDDLLVLCHARYAFDFVRAACTRFSEVAATRSATYKQNSGADLWPATGGRLTISTGVLFCSTTLPLSSALPYAESLLASAKSRGRQDPQEGQPAPPCVDWESVTESLLDTPAARRLREVRFVDDDLGGNQIVELTQRPYAVQGLDQLKKLAERYSEIPHTIWLRLVREMRAGYWDRQVALARLAKRHPKIVSDLSENQEGPMPKESRWKLAYGVRSTDVLDALGILEERARMSRTTVEEGAR